MPDSEQEALASYYSLLERYGWNEETLCKLYMTFVTESGHLDEFIGFLERVGADIDAAEMEGAVEESKQPPKMYLRYKGARVKATAIIWNNSEKPADLMSAGITDPGFVYAMPGTFGTIVHVDKREDAATVRWDYSGKATIVSWDECESVEPVMQEVIDRLNVLPNPLDTVLRFFSTQARINQLEMFIRQVVESTPAHTSAWFFLNGRMRRLPHHELSYETLCGLAGGGRSASRLPIVVVERANEQLPGGG